MSNKLTKKELANLGPAPAGHTYFGIGFGYWARSTTDAAKVYRECKTGKHHVVIHVAPDTDLKFDGITAGISWNEADLDHDYDTCEVCTHYRVS